MLKSLAMPTEVTFTEASSSISTEGFVQYSFFSEGLVGKVEPFTISVGLPNGHPAHSTTSLYVSRVKEGSTEVFFVDTALQRSLQLASHKDDGVVDNTIHALRLKGFSSPTMRSNIVLPFRFDPMYPPSCIMEYHMRIPVVEGKAEIVVSALKREDMMKESVEVSLLQRKSGNDPYSCLALGRLVRSGESWMLG